MRRTLDRRCLAAIVVGLSTALQPALSVRAEESNFVRIEHNRPDGAIVGERVSLSVQILTDTWLSQAATITVPEVPGLILHKVSAFGLNGTERVGAVTYTTQAHEYAVFARRSGQFIIPAFRLRFGVAGQPAGTKVMLDLETDPIVLEAEMPPGAEGIEGLISATDLTAIETWDPDSEDELSMGDALKRSITYRAEGVMGMAFPPTRFDPVDGLGVYPEPPELDDQTQRGDFLGSRQDAATYVVERAGTFVIPGLTVPWWDLDAGEMKQIDLPSRTWVVSAAPALPQTATGSRSSGNRHIWAGALLIFGVVVVTFLPPFRRAWRSLWYRWQLRWREWASFRRVIDTCAGSDCPKALDCLRTWHGMVRPDRSLTASAAEFGDPRLMEALRELEQNVYGQPGEWKGLKLAERVRIWRRSLGPGRSVNAVESLPPLNP